MKKKVGGGSDQGGCEPRIEVIVKMKKKSRGSGPGVGGGGWGIGVGGFGDVNQELKVLLKEHKGIVQY